MLPDDIPRMSPSGRCFLIAATGAATGSGVGLMLSILSRSELAREFAAVKAKIDSRASSLLQLGIDCSIIPLAKIVLFTVHPLHRIQQN